jgi:acyl-CoA thioester hydrolase
MSGDPPILLLRHRLTVRFRDCDPLGHVNNAVYLTYLEQARFTLWRAQLGFLPRDSQQRDRGTGFILARVECDFRAQVRYGDELEVRLSLGGFGRTSFTYTYDIMDAMTDRLVAAAKTVLVRYDYDAEKAAPLDDDLKRQLATPVLDTL